MKLWINAAEANVVQRVGSNVYAFEVLWQLYRKEFDEVVVFLPSNPISELPPARNNWQYEVIRPSAFWSVFALPIALWKKRIQGRSADLVLSLGQYAPLFPPVPSVICVMDLAYIQFLSQFKFVDQIKLMLFSSYSILQARKIIAISQFTKNEIVHYYHKSSDAIEVAYPASKPLSQNSSKNDGGEKSRLDSKLKLKLRHYPYILYVGTIQPRKNISRLVEAFESLKELFPKLQLVILGKVGWKSESSMQTIKDSPYSSDIHLTGFVSDKDKNSLIASATCLVLVGMYEGFGIPPLEAMQLGTIPVVSSTSSLPEVVGDAGMMVSPFNSQDIGRGLLQILMLSDEEKVKWSARAKKAAKAFSWEKTGNKIYSILTQEDK